MIFNLIIGLNINVCDESGRKDHGPFGTRLKFTKFAAAAALFKFWIEPIQSKSNGLEIVLSSSEWSCVSGEDLILAALSDGKCCREKGRIK